MRLIRFQALSIFAVGLWCPACSQWSAFDPGCDPEQLFDDGNFEKADDVPLDVCHKTGLEDSHEKVVCDGNTWTWTLYEKTECTNVAARTETGNSGECTRIPHLGGYSLMVNCPNTKKKTKKNISTEAIIGIVIGSLAFIVLLVLIIRRYRSSNESGSFTLINML